MPSPTTNPQRGLTSDNTITIAHITDCPTVTIHAGKCYQALIDSGAAISLIRHSTYKQIDDPYKTPIQSTAAKLNTADGSPMTILGSTALHLHIADFTFTHNFIICNQLPDTEFILGMDIQRSFHCLTLGIRITNATYKGMENSYLLCMPHIKRPQLELLNPLSRYHPDTMGWYPSKSVDHQSPLTQLTS